MATRATIAAAVTALAVIGKIEIEALVAEMATAASDKASDKVNDKPNKVLEENAGASDSQEMDADATDAAVNRTEIATIRTVLDPEGASAATDIMIAADKTVAAATIDNADGDQNNLVHRSMVVGILGHHVIQETIRDVTTIHAEANIQSSAAARNVTFGTYLSELTKLKRSPIIIESVNGLKKRATPPTSSSPPASGWYLRASLRNAFFISSVDAVRGTPSVL